jgi:hypothetical protein
MYRVRQKSSQSRNEPYLTPKATVPPNAATKVDEQTKLKTEVKGVVQSYFDQWKNGKGAENLKLFRSPQIPVTGLMHGPKTEHWQKSAADYMKRFPDKPIEYLSLESIEIDVVHEGLATARVKYKGGGHRDTALFTMSREKDHWQIVSLFVDSHFVW